MASPNVGPAEPAGEPCPACRGFGYLTASTDQLGHTCPDCAGSGLVGGWKRRASDHAGPVKRVTANELNRMLLARLVTPPRDRSSVSISRNAKHQYQFEVTVHAGDQGVSTAEDAERIAGEITDRLAAKYPPPEPEPVEAKP